MTNRFRGKPDYATELAHVVADLNRIERASGRKGLAVSRSSTRSERESDLVVTVDNGEVSTSKGE
ncbi:hypothetical protein [Salininema proteolyticum]|uniref:Uncharacterized protein n=1 Tax=Salininema proteolyticum TaxID=1607685 RepID=A0ABV8U4Z0_9ACTN